MNESRFIIDLGEFLYFNLDQWLVRIELRQSPRKLVPMELDIAIESVCKVRMPIFDASRGRR